MSYTPNTSYLFNPYAAIENSHTSSVANCYNQNQISGCLPDFTPNSNIEKMSSNVFHGQDGPNVRSIVHAGQSHHNNAGAMYAVGEGFTNSPSHSTAGPSPGADHRSTGKPYHSTAGPSPGADHRSTGKPYHSTAGPSPGADHRSTLKPYHSTAGPSPGVNKNLDPSMTQEIKNLEMQEQQIMGEEQQIADEINRLFNQQQQQPM